MNLNSLDANAVTQPGGLYASANNGILEALKAYFAFKDRQQQGERQMVRDERTNRRDQRTDAISLARTLGVRPPPEARGWLAPEDDAAVEAAAGQFQQGEQDRQTAELGKRMQLIRGGVQLPDMTPAEAAEFSRAASERALGLKRQGTQDQLASVQLEMAKNQAVTTSPAWKAAAGVGNTLSDWVSKGIEAAGRQKRPADGWRQGDMGFMSRDLGDGFSASRDPAGKVSIVGPTGETMTAEQYQKLRGSLSQAVGAGQPGQPGVDTTAPPAPLGGWTQDKEDEFQGQLIKKAIADGKTFAGSRTWKPDGSPVLSQAEVAYEQTLPASERAALAQAMASSNFTIRAKASAKLNADATAWAKANRK
jgi:hypothetical protein